jgi:hypothetical protein
MKLLPAAVIALILATNGTAGAAAFFSTGFSGTSLSTNLTTWGSSTFSTGQTGTGYAAGQTVLNLTTVDDRSYVQTIATDYNAVDFTMKLTYTQSCCDSPVGLVFIGLGDPSPGDNNTEPANGVFMRLHPSANANADGLANRSAGGPFLSYNGSPPIGAGEHTAEIVKSGDLLMFYMDAANNGTFVQFGSTMDLSTPALSYLNSSNSRLFFGTGDSQPQFVSLSISGSEAVPEPASIALLGAGLMGLLAASRRVSRT